MSEVELKPCPFCGYVPETVTVVDDGRTRYFKVECLGDCSVIPSSEGGSYDEAVKSWNTRPSQWVKYPETKPKYEGRYLVLYRYKDDPRLRPFIGDFLPEFGWNCLLDNTVVDYFSEIPALPEPFKG